VSESDLQSLWLRSSGAQLAFTDARLTAQMKMTDRERDWAFVGELARLLVDPRDALRFSRSPRDLERLVRANPALARELAGGRPLLALVGTDAERIEGELDRERRAAMHANERRLSVYAVAARAWVKAWPNVERATAGMSLEQTHRVVIERASACLPMAVSMEPAP
jgi:hypothetical protein